MIDKNQTKKMFPFPRLGEIWLVEFPLTLENRKSIRPCWIISDNIQNQYGKWIVVIPLTTEDVENIESFEVFAKDNKENGLDHPSKLQFNYPRTVDRARLKKQLGILNRGLIGELKEAWRFAFNSKDWDW